MLNINLIQVIITILAENGETRALTLIKLINSYTDNIEIDEPIVFEHIISKKFKNNIMSIPLDNVRVDWGDGYTAEKPQIIKHEYRELDKIYRVKIYNLGGKTEIINDHHFWSRYITYFISIGRIGVRHLNFIFTHNNLNFKISPNWDTSQIVSISGMFFEASKFNQKIGDNWDTSHMTYIIDMLYGAKNFNQKIGDKWNTSKMIGIIMFGNIVKPESCKWYYKYKNK